VEQNLNNFRFNKHPHARDFLTWNLDKCTKSC